MAAARKEVLIASALLDGSSLRNAVRVGLGAVLSTDRILIAHGERTKVGDSLDLDEATRPEFPHAHRWDYLLSVPQQSYIVGLEPHSATDHEVKVVIAKKKHAVDYLRGHLPAQLRVARWFWVSRGRVGFSRMDKARRLLDQHGIAFEGHSLRSLA